MWAVVGALLVLALGTAVAAALAHRRAAELRAELQAVRASADSKQPERSNALLPPKPYEASAREALAEASSPWPEALVAIETAKADGVVLTSLEILPREALVRVEVQFEDYKSLLDYLEQLNAGEPKPRWFLVEARRDAVQPTSSSASIRGTLKP